MYDRTSDHESVNDAARKQLFTQKSRSLENLPLIQAALVQHIKRASYQENCWDRALHLDHRYRHDTSTNLFGALRPLI